MKRGPKVGDEYPIVGRHKVSREFADLARRRTQAFTDRIGLDDRSISELLQEAWLQGVKDGAAACGALDQPNQE